jgi:hypothetical protein
MRKILFFFLVIPALGFGQTKNVVSTNRVFPKIDKVLEFEKALAAHAAKYHKGDWNWRVFEIQSGPDAGGYHITEGPASWSSFDTRGNLGTEHNNDWNKNVAVYLTDRGSAGYSEYVDSLSTVKLNDFSDKIIISHMKSKPGYAGKIAPMIAQLKKAWAVGGESMAVYTSVASGDPEYAMVQRLKGGLKELEDGYRKPMPERFEQANGAGSWAQYLKDYAQYVDNRWSEMLFLRADLSSK